MVSGGSMFITDKKSLAVFVDSDEGFFVKELLWLAEERTDESLYQQVVFKIRRKPNKLMNHIQRVFLSYSLGMQEQLYAALVDLLWVLDGKGSALSGRMLGGTRSALTDHQFKSLETYLQQPDRAALEANQYTVCTSGTLGASELMLSNSKNNKQDYDPLELARDYIEYSQLDEALATLEAAILTSPERQDVLKELLDLLMITKNFQAYTKIRNVFVQRKLLLSAEWQALADYFAEINDEKK